jgi:hypothetical protein
MYHCPHGQHVVNKQHCIGLRMGVSIMGNCQPPPGGSVGGPLSKQKTRGKASGDPQTQIKSATYSMAGLTASNPSATHPKQPSHPHPSLQQSQHRLSTQPPASSPMPIIPIIRPAIVLNLNLNLYLNLNLN